MSAGDYVCRFKNPDLNAEKTVSVHVEPGSNQKVVVQLP
jgi:hypothetical protein